MKTLSILRHGLLLGALVLAGGWLATPPRHRLILAPESRLWIEGTSTVNAFTCRAAEVDGYGFLKDDAPLAAANRAEAAQAGGEVVVPVRSFDCGKRMMNRDFYDALKAKAHPQIRYSLESAEVLRPARVADAPFEIRATGRLEIAGAARRIVTTATGRRLAEGQYRIEGRQALLMRDFGVDPPTAFLGLIKARERIVVRFDLVAVPATIIPETR